MNNSVETINAAATAIVAAESRVQQATIQVDRRIFDQELFFFFCFLIFGDDCWDLGEICVIMFVSSLFSV